MPLYTRALTDTHTHTQILSSMGEVKYVPLRVGVSECECVCVRERESGEGE